MGLDGNTESTVGAGAQGRNPRAPLNPAAVSGFIAKKIGLVWEVRSDELHNRRGNYFLFDLCCGTYISSVD